MYFSNISLENIYFSWNFCNKKHIKIYILMFHTLLYNLARSDEKHNKYIRFLDFNVKRYYCSCIILISHFVLQCFFLHLMQVCVCIIVIYINLGKCWSVYFFINFLIGKHQERPFEEIKMSILAYPELFPFFEQT